MSENWTKGPLDDFKQILYDIYLGETAAELKREKEREIAQETAEAMRDEDIRAAREAGVWEEGDEILDD